MLLPPVGMLLVSALAEPLADDGALNCSLNGVLDHLSGGSSSCICDDGWQGARCSALKQGTSVRVWPPAGTAGQDARHLAAR